MEANSAAYARNFSGVLSAVDSRVDPVNRSLTARASFANEDGLLKPGLLMTVVLLGPERMALLVPEASLTSRAQVHYVWRLEGDSARRVEVVIGGRRPGWVEITEGLSSGDEVVRDGVVRLRGTEANVRRVDS